MTASGFTRFVSVAVGIAALPVVVLALANAAAYPRAPLTDAIRFGVVLLGGGLSLALMFNHRLVPALRKAALHAGPYVVRVLCAIAIGILALTARLAGVPAAWFGLAAGLLVVAYVVPGVAFRGIVRLPGLGLHELSVIAGQNMRELPMPVRIVITTIVLLPVFGAVTHMLGLQTIPSPGWAKASQVVAACGGLLSAAVFFGIFFLAAPPGERRRVLPRMLLWSAFWLAIAVFGFWALMARGTTAAAAALWGSEASQQAVVLASERFENRKGCRGVLEIRTATAASQEICNLPPELLRSLRPGDTIEIAGSATVLGQTIRRVARAD